MTALGPDATRAWIILDGPPPDHPRFVGPPVDFSVLTTFELGSLLARTYGPRTWTGPAAYDVVQRLRQSATIRSPRFDATAGQDFLIWLSERGPDRTSPGRAQLVAAQVILRCADALGSGGGDAAALLARLPGTESPIARLAVAAAASPRIDAEVLAATATELQGHPLAVAELSLLGPLDAASRSLLAEPIGFDAMAPPPDFDARLAGLAEYVAGGRRLLEAAAARADAIGAGKTPYVPDRAFTRPEVATLARITRVALHRDEPWIGPCLQGLLPLVAVAPTAAKTVPSQAACLQLSAEIVDRPTPESVEAIARARRVVRHATVTKRLDRALRAASLALARRPGVALRLPPGPLSKSQLRAWLTALEAGLAAGTTMPCPQWAAMLAATPEVAALASALVWNVGSGPDRVAVMPDLAGGTLLLSIDGQPIDVPQDASVGLWHPAAASPAERSAWRERIMARRIRQPFRQVFREHYHVAGDNSGGGPGGVPGDDATGMFAGYVVAMKPFIGLAGRDGWQLDNVSGTIHRDVAGWRLTFGVAGQLYPGADSTGRTEKLHLSVLDGVERRTRNLADAPAVLISELLRSLDLLVSASAVAATDSPYEDTFDPALPAAVSTTTALRRDALQRILADPIAAGHVAVAARHVTVGGYAVHLSTARVTRDGDPVTLELPKRTRTTALPWLPYDERLLEQIVHTVQVLLDRTRTRPGA